MTSTAPPVIRIFEAVSLVFPRNATMPPGATAQLCLLCQRHSPQPPAKAVWISAGGEDGLYPVCSDCGWDLSDDEIEARILELVTAPAPIAAE
jgi:hypothetical protein